MRIHPHAWQITGAAVWAVVCALGMGTLWAYASEPGDVGTPTDVWRLDERIPLDDERPTLVLFAHPRCPCTLASMTAIERLAGRYPDRFAFVAVFFEPDGASSLWRATPLWGRARAIPGGRTVADVGGLLASRAGAQTSGVVGLYEPDGDLLFWGGVTSARGHEGDSLGCDALGAALKGETEHDTRAPVYGCSILGACADEVCEARGAGE